MKRISKQMSETIELGIVLALSGGFMDAYSYMCRDHVFANAQTGHIPLFGVNLSQGNWGTALHYLGPILAFIVGLALSDLFRLIRRGGGGEAVAALGHVPGVLGDVHGVVADAL